MLPLTGTRSRGTMLPMTGHGPGDHATGLWRRSSDCLDRSTALLNAILPFAAVNKKRSAGTSAHADAIFPSRGIVTAPHRLLLFISHDVPIGGITVHDAIGAISDIA
ncbi:hypothetical protein Q31a_59840 [Aureliella helgolandensis]|uniref:Uncharacterized protein n=1 Tax=Aureliella helgolandensis TaxID=2527968 RepID=A0A518GG65_9BACT|nr:hypothetical protein Q31a_59840 [Aureliella helgolandensis]